MENFTNEEQNGTDQAENTHDVESYGLWLQAFLTVISLLSIPFSIMAIVALNRTRSTPEITRFMSSWLLAFDTLGMLSFSLQRLTEDGYANTSFYIIAMLWGFLAYVTICMMALERYVVLKYPYFYIQYVTLTTAKIIAFSVWAFIVFIYCFTRIGLCFMIYSNVKIQDLSGRCKATPFVVYTVTIVIVIIVSSICYIKIFFIVKSKGDVNSKPRTIIGTLKALKNYKSTSIVFVYLLTIIIVSISYMFILVMKVKQPHSEKFRLPTDFINLFNNIMDACMYVLWFRECRMEMLKMCPFFPRRISRRVESMRMDIYNIVIKEQKTASSSAAGKQPVVNEVIPGQTEATGSSRSNVAANQNNQMIAVAPSLKEK